MNFDSFIAKWNMRGIDFDGAYANQCMDLMHQYCVEVLGLSDGRILAAPAAKDVWLTNVFGKDKFEAISNTPTGVPQKGDIIFWGTEVGPYGHVAVVVSANVDSFKSFDQNWSGHQYCEIVTHKYGGTKGVLGWLRYKGKPVQVSDEMVCDTKATRDMLVAKATQRDDVCTYLGLPLYVDQTDSTKITSTIGGFKSRITDLTNQVAGATAEVANREEQVSRLRQEVLDSEKVKKALTDNLNEATKKITDVQGVYEGQLVQKQTVIEQYAKDKGTLQIEVAQLTAQLADAKKNSVKSLSVSDLIRLLLAKLGGNA